MNRRPRILYLSPCWPHAPTHGGQLRALHIGRALRQVADVRLVIVAADAPDASGADRSFLCMELERETSRTRLSSALAAAGLKPDDIVMRGNHLLVEVDGYVPSDDPRLAQLAEIGRPVVLGAYAIPVAEGTP